MVGLADETRVQPADEAAAPRYPIILHRVDGSMALHSCSFRALRVALPSDNLHPLRQPNGRALLAFSLYQKREVSAASGEQRVALPPEARARPCHPGLDVALGRYEVDDTRAAAR